MCEESLYSCCVWEARLLIPVQNSVVLCSSVNADEGIHAAHQIWQLSDHYLLDIPSPCSSLLAASPMERTLCFMLIQESSKLIYLIVFFIFPADSIVLVSSSNFWFFSLFILLLRPCGLKIFGLTRE